MLITLKTKLTFTQQITIASSVILFLALSILSGVQYYLIKFDMEELIENNMKEVTQALVTTIDQAISNKMELASFAASVIQDNYSEETIELIINKNILKDAFHVTGFAQSSDGKFVTNEASFKIDPWDPRTEAWYKKAQDDQTTIMSEPFVSSINQEPVITLATPIIADYNLQGVLFHDLNLQIFVEALNDMTFHSMGYTFLISEQGLVVSHPKKELIGKSISQDIGDIKIIEGRQILQNNGDTRYIDFSKAVNQPLYVGAIIDRDKVLESVWAVRNFSILFTFGMLVFSIFVLGFIISRLLRPIVLMKESLEKALSGDMDAIEHLSEEMSGELGELTGKFHDFTNNIQDTLSKTKEICDHIKNEGESNKTIYAQSQDAFAQQETEVEQLAAAMNQMSSTSVEVAERAQETSNATQVADQAAQDGTHIVAQTTNSINQLAEQIEASMAAVHKLSGNVKDIEKILEVINDIADQTNLLALNAAIEAARAGEKGRGFAVVADEVRNLSKRTQDATSQISGMIQELQTGATLTVTTMEDSQRITLSTVEHSQEASDAIQVILNSIEQINQMNLQIATAAEEQSKVAEEMNQKTISIKDSTQITSDNVKKVMDSVQAQEEYLSKQEEVLERYKT